MGNNYQANKVNGKMGNIYQATKAVEMAGRSRDIEESGGQAYQV
jgi:hypothetical protein